MVVFSVFVIVWSSTIALTKTLSFEDVRCLCVCTVINGSDISKNKYIANVPPSKDCNEVSLPISSEVNSFNKKELYPGCICSYQSRITTTIMVAVMIVISVILLLVTYMVYLLCLEPIIRGCKKDDAFVEDTNNEEHDNTPSVSLGTRGSDPVSSVATSSNVTSSNVFDRFGHQQDKWKIRVKEQRNHVYDLHSVLN